MMISGKVEKTIFPLTLSIYGMRRNIGHMRANMNNSRAQLYATTEIDRLLRLENKA
jgi:hypothetical protein